MSRVHALVLSLATLAAGPAHAQDLHPACADQATKLVTSTQGPYQLTSSQGPYQLTSSQGPYQLAPVLLDEAYGRELPPAAFNGLLTPTTTAASVDYLLELDGIKFSDPSGLEDAGIDPDEIDYDGTQTAPGVEPDEIDYDGSQETTGIDPDEIDYDGARTAPGVEPDEIDYDGAQTAPGVEPDEIDYDGSQETTGIDPDEIDVAAETVLWMTLIPGKYQTGDVVGCAVLDQAALSAAAPR